MRLIEINALPNGAHRNQTINTEIPVPEGWAYIPDDMTIPQTFPFVNIEVEEKTYTHEVEVQMEGTDEDGNTKTEILTENREYTMMTVTAMIEGTLPEPDPMPEDGPTVWDELDAAYQEGVDSV